MCGEALRLSRAKSNINTWERIRNKELLNKIRVNLINENF